MSKGMTKMNTKKQGGFSLIEIMVVIIIIGMIAAGVGTQLFGKADESRVKQVKIDFSAIEQALSLYRLDNFRYPSNEQGLEALVNKPSIDPIPKNYSSSGYLKKPALDPWGNPYVYIIPGENGEYDLYSLGADGQSGGEGFDADIFNNQ